MKNSFLCTVICAWIIILNALCNGFCADGDKAMRETVYEQILKEVKEKDGVKEITYKQLMEIRNSGEPFIIVDVLSAESYKEGHINGAVSFPMETINKETAAGKFKNDSNIIVYCGSFQCMASTESAKRLKALGYRVLDYKGGLKEWQEKGNKLEK